MSEHTQLSLSIPKVCQTEQRSADGRGHDKMAVAVVADGQCTCGCLRAYLATVIVGPQVAFHEKHCFTGLNKRRDFGVMANGAVHSIGIIAAMIGTPSGVT